MHETHSPPYLPQYDIEGTLDEKENCRLYRARQRGASQRVLLKTVPLRVPSAVVRLQHEYTLSHRLDLTGIMRVIDFITTEADSVLVLADPGAEPLARLLSNGPLPLATALNVARQLAQTLAELHQRDLIHQAVCPNNVWVNVATGDAKLTGFGDAAPLGHAWAVSQRCSLLHLDPRYLAPEQSGRINRCVDYRTDYYALGVLLFEMLNGQAPFQGQELLSLLYAHIAQPPPALRELAPIVPEAVATMVHKLLAKAAEDRYQSGWSIAADLDRGINRLATGGAIPAFEPGQHDLPLRFELPQCLCGREAEREHRVQSFDAACVGVSQVCLIAGSAGVGKTACIQELQPHVLQRGGVFASGTWDKLAQLYERYPDLLGATAHRLPVAACPAAPVDETLATIAASATQDLDLRSVEQATIALRSERHLPTLLSRLMALVLETSGAQRGILVHEENGGWVVDASATVDAAALRVTAAASRPAPEDVPVTLLRYAARTNDALVLDDAAQDARFAQDTYLQRTHPAALLCAPFVQQSRAVTLLYLEHHQLRGVFSTERCAAVQLIAAQAAGALANARMYQALQRELAQRQRAEGELRQAVDEVATLHEKLTAENVYLREEIASDHDFTEIVGQSAPVRQVLHQVELVAPTDTSVLILGETGTGKELIARALHDRSPRRHRPLIKVNCAALPATLIESELFGHEKGAFTGALRTKLGRFELADQGTLFLDEIGDLPLELQAKLLRVLQEGEFERLGSSQTLHVDVRIISATNRDLPQAVAEGVFRADLYYRLSVFPLQAPPLRERREDIPLLVWYFISKHQGKLGKRISEVPRRAMAMLEAYAWPGNVRELESVLERALILSPGTTLVLDDSVFLSQTVPHDDAMSSVAAQGSLHVMEREHICSVLAQCAWHIQGPGNAAERLGLAPSTLRFRMRKLGIKRP